jgi:hypothetical protein
LFEVHEISGSAMVLQLQVLLEKNGLIHNVITFVKDGGNNFKIMVTTMKSITNHGPLKKN